MRSNQFLFRKRSITFFPQQQLIPLQKLSLQPSVDGLGSDQSISETTLLPAGSIGRLMVLSEEMLLTRGLNPPWTQKMRLETTAAMGKKLKVSDMIFHVFMLILLLHSSQNPYSLLSQLDSWFPLSIKKLLGYLILYAMRRQMHSNDCFPLSTQSPRKRQFLLSGVPNSLKIVSKSVNCPCVSPQICMGASNSRSMGCSIMMLLIMTQRPSTSYSLKVKERSLQGVSVSLMIISSILMFLRLLPYFIHQLLISKLFSWKTNRKSQRQQIIRMKYRQKTGGRLLLPSVLED